MRRKYERNGLPIQLSGFEIIGIGFFCIGILLGALFANSLEISQSDEIMVLVDNFIINTKEMQFPALHLLRQSMFVRGKQIVLIWILGLVPLSIPFIMIVLASQGFSYGFTASFFIMQYGFKGMLFCLCAYGLQGALFICTLFLMSTQSILHSRKEHKNHFKRYVLYLCIATIVVFLIGLLDAYITPFWMYNIASELIAI